MIEFRMTDFPMHYGARNTRFFLGLQCERSTRVICVGPRSKNSMYQHCSTALVVLAISTTTMMMLSPTQALIGMHAPRSSRQDQHGVFQHLVRHQTNNLPILEKGWTQHHYSGLAATDGAFSSGSGTGGGSGNVGSGVKKSSTAADSAKSSGNTGRTTAIIEYDDFLPQPNAEMTATDVVKACMTTLLERKDGAGLEVCFHFSSDRCRAALGGSLEKFKQYSTNPIFGYLINCEGYNILSVGPEIVGTPTRGAMQTVLMDAKKKTQRPNTTSSSSSSSISLSATKKEQSAIDEDDSRRFLWTLQRERRPPLQGCWIIHEVMYVRNAFEQTM